MVTSLLVIGATYSVVTGLLVAVCNIFDNSVGWFTVVVCGGAQVVVKRLLAVGRYAVVVGGTQGVVIPLSVVGATYAVVTGLLVAACDSLDLSVGWLAVVVWGRAHVVVTRLLTVGW